MTNDTKIRPALTAEEWRPDSKGMIGTSEAGAWPGGSVEFNGEYPVERPHAVAAVCLYGQPFGFTREDVRLLIWANHALDDDGVETETCLKFAELAARIEALLPPA
jgi:hypothetical protein